MDLGLKNAGPCKVLGEGAAFLLVNAGVWSKTRRRAKGISLHIGKFGEGALQAKGGATV